MNETSYDHYRESIRTERESELFTLWSKGLTVEEARFHLRATTVTDSTKIYRVMWFMIANWSSGSKGEPYFFTVDASSPDDAIEQVKRFYSSEADWSKAHFVVLPDQKVLVR
jgi:hypothetical protein